MSTATIIYLFLYDIWNSTLSIVIQNLLPEAMLHIIKRQQQNTNNTSFVNGLHAVFIIFHDELIVIIYICTTL